MMKTFMSDMFANVISSQVKLLFCFSYCIYELYLKSGACGDFELKALECIEYYGAKQAITACRDWYDDFLECQSGAKQKLRMRAMFKKRHIDNHLEYLQVATVI